MTAQQWFFVQLHDDVLGPLSAPELHELARRGSIGRQTLISSDRTTWVAAESLAGLEFAPAVPTRISEPTPTWVLVLTAVAAVIAVAIVLLIVVASLFSRATNAQPSAGSTVASTRKSAYQPSVPDTGHLTLLYWQQIAAVLNNSPNTDDPSLAVQTWRQAAARLRGTPTSGVDLDAVQCGNDVAAVLGNLADVVTHSNSPEFLVESFLRGAAGDPLGAAAEAVTSQSNMQQQLQQVQHELDNTRAILSARYGIEFPAL